MQGGEKQPGEFRGCSSLGVVEGTAGSQLQSDVHWEEYIGPGKKGP